MSNSVLQGTSNKILEHSAILIHFHGWFGLFKLSNKTHTRRINLKGDYCAFLLYYFSNELLCIMHCTQFLIVKIVKHVFLRKKTKYFGVCVHHPAMFIPPRFRDLVMPLPPGRAPRCHQLVMLNWRDTIRKRCEWLGGQREEWMTSKESQGSSKHQEREGLRSFRSIKALILARSRAAKPGQA